MNCKQISQNLTQIKKLKENFDEILRQENFNIDSLLELASGIEQEIEDTYEKLGPDYRFIYELSKPQNWEKLRKETKDIGVHLNTHKPEHYKIFKDIFTNFTSNVELTSENLEHFLSLMKASPRLHEQLYKHLGKATALDRKYYELILATYINKFIKSSSNIEIKDLHSQFNSCVGSYLERGRVSVAKAGFGAGIYSTGGQLSFGKTGTYAGAYNDGAIIDIDNADMNTGYHMQSGRINIDISAKSELGKEMAGGVIRAYETNSLCGAGMEGGVIFCRKAGEDLGRDMKGGVIIVDSRSGKLAQNSTGGTILYHHASDPVDTSAQANIYYFKEYLVESYNALTANAPVPEKITSEQQLDQFKKTNQGLVTIPKLGSEDQSGNYAPLFKKSITEGMKDGIIVLQEFPEKSDQKLGQGMEGGALIVDVKYQNWDYESLYDSICFDRKGGMILTRRWHHDEKTDEWTSQLEEII